MKYGVRIAALLLCLVLCGCAAQPVVEKQSFALDTFITVKILSGGDEQDAEAALQRVDACEALLSAHRAGSDIDRLNASAGEFVEVNEVTERVLRGAMELSALSGGALDVTLYEVSGLWNYKSDAPRVPAQEQIDAALKSRGMDRIALDAHAFALDGVKIDLGAIAKGAIGDEARKALQECGVKTAILNLGGNIVTLGDKPGGSGWVIAVEDPLGDGTVGNLRFYGSMSVATSSGKQRYFVADGKTYHHILDPETGCPADAGLLSATVIAPDGLTADALSTAVFVMGEDRARAMFEQHFADQKIGAVLVRSDSSICVLGDADFTGK